MGLLRRWCLFYDCRYETVCSLIGKDNSNENSFHQYLHCCIIFCEVAVINTPHLTVHLGLGVSCALLLESGCGLPSDAKCVIFFSRTRNRYLAFFFLPLACFSLFFRSFFCCFISEQINLPLKNPPVTGSSRTMTGRWKMGGAPVN